MGLEHDQDALPQPARGGERRFDLGRVMAVVVNDAHAARLAAGLEPAAHPLERPQGLGDVAEAHLDLEPHRGRGQRVEHVVAAGGVDLDLARVAAEGLDAEARAVGKQLDVGRPHVGLGPRAVEHRAPRDLGHDAAHLGIVPAQHGDAVERHPVREVDERLEHGVEGLIVVEVLAVDVGDDRHGGREAQERAVALVGLGDQELPLAEARVRAQGVEPPADHDRGVEPAPRQHRGDHRGGGRLAVRTGDRDPELHPHELGQHLGAADDRQPQLARRGELRIVGRDGGRVDHDLRALDVRGRMPDDDPPAELDQAVVRFGPGFAGCPAQVAARDLVAHVEEHLGDARHAGAADADEVDAAEPPVHQSVPPSGSGARAARRPADQRSRPWTMRSAASGRANFRAFADMRDSVWRSLSRCAISRASRSPERSRSRMSAAAPRSTRLLALTT